MPGKYFWRRDLSKYTLKSFDSANEHVCDINNSDLLTYDANGTNKVVVDTTSAQVLLAKTLAAADGIVKVQPVTGTKTWASGVAYPAFTTTQATLLGSGGIVFWTMVAINATDVQVLSFHTTYSAANKAGTTAVAHTYIGTTDSSLGSSTGTFTVTATATDSGSGLATFNVTGTSSITPTTLQLSFTVFPLVGAVTIL
jgi:hypothetical protein